MTAALYPGVVTHARLRPRPHRLRYRIFMLALDLDELPALRRLLCVRLGLVGFRERDHLDGSATPLKVQVERHLAAAGLEGGGRILLLCMPRILGHGFNPLSVYYCHRPGGSLSAILYEVNNTFGGRHSYLIPAPAQGRIDQAVGKAFHVSPFMDMDLAYAFRIVPPGEEVGIRVNVDDARGRVLSAAFAGRRRDLTDAALARAVAGHPWMVLGVLCAIHWEALKIWLKGERLRPSPPAPARPVTFQGPPPLGEASVASRD